MAISDFRLLGSASLVGAFSLINNAQAMDIDASINYAGPFFKQIVSAADDQLASGAASGIALKFEEAHQGDLSKPKTVQDSRGKYWFGATVGTEKIVVCGATIKEDGSGIGPGFVRSEITTSNGAVKTEKINSDCRSVLKAAYESMLKSVGESSSVGETSTGNRKQNLPE